MRILSDMTTLIMKVVRYDASHNYVVYERLFNPIFAALGKCTSKHLEVIVAPLNSTVVVAALKHGSKVICNHRMLL